MSGDAPPPLRVERDGAVVRATLHRPARRNAMSRALLAAFDAMLDDLEGDTTGARVLLLSGAGGHFCSGLDLSEVGDEAGDDEAARLATGQARNAAMGARFARLSALPQVVVARIEGSCFAGGLGLAAAADIALCDAATARFAASEARIGLVPAQILPWLVRRMGRAQATRLVLQARPLDGAEAARVGLVHAALPDAATLEAEVARVVADLALGGPRALAETKALLAALGPVAPEGYGALAAEAFARCSRGEAREGIAAFRDKRPPAWAPRP